jgi:hypothetical protein
MPQPSRSRRLPSLSSPARLSAAPWAGLAPSGAWLLVLLLGLTLPRAQASSPADWRTYDQEVRSACLRASGLNQPRVLGERVDVPVADPKPSGITLLISALLLEGRFSQPFQRGQMGRELCLFEQRTRKATVAGADNLAKPRPKP